MAGHFHFLPAEVRGKDVDCFIRAYQGVKSRPVSPVDHVATWRIPPVQRPERGEEEEMVREG